MYTIKLGVCVCAGAGALMIPEHDLRIMLNRQVFPLQSVWRFIK